VWCQHVRRAGYVPQALDAGNAYPILLVFDHWQAVVNSVHDDAHSSCSDARSVAISCSTEEDCIHSMAGQIKGEGILYVKARISRQDILDEPGYMKWYDKDHIAEIIETSGVDNAFRYKDIEQDRATCSYPYLAFYPMKEMAFTLGEEFRKIKVKSDLLPGTGICYDVADNEVRYLKLVGKTEAPKKQG
jgi:hypothetical protein